MDAEICAGALRYAAQGALRYLETSQGWQQMSLLEGQFHTGDDPYLADDEAHQEFEACLRRHPAWTEMRVWNVVGEEKIVPLPGGFRPGARVVVVDPLDGSTQWAMSRQGYCVAAISLLADSGGELKLECGIVATPVHTFTLIGDRALKFGPTFEGPGVDIEILSTLAESEFRPKSLAINGHKARDRNVVVGVMNRLPDWDIVTLGGNPATPYVVVGSLTGSVNTRWQCTWDALGVLMCTATDAVVGHLDGTSVSSPDFRSLFNTVLLEGNVRSIPPMIAAKNSERLHEIAMAVSAALEADPPPDLMEP